MEIQKNERYAKACVEVLEVIQFLGQKYKNKLPKKLLEQLENNRDQNYKYKIKENTVLQEQNLSDETIGLLTVIELRYWCTNEEEREELSNTLIENEKKCQEERNKQHSANNSSKKIGKKKEEYTEENVAMVEYKESFFKKIMNKIKSVLKKY